MLSGAVKRLRSTNQLKEGMERIIIDQCRIPLLSDKQFYTNRFELFAFYKAS